MDALRAMNPTPKKIRDARLSAGLSQSDAARMVYVTLRAWQRWEASGKEGRPIPGAAWELFGIKVRRMAASVRAKERDATERAASVAAGPGIPMEYPDPEPVSG